MERRGWSDGYRVRPYGAADREAVLCLASRLAVGIAPWRDPDAMRRAARSWVEGSIERIGPDAAVLVAEDPTGECAGFISVARETHFTGDAQAYVGELSVREEREGQGIGGAVMEPVEEWARHGGLELVVLHTGAANERGRRFYERLGYVVEIVMLTKVLD